MNLLCFAFTGLVWFQFLRNTDGSISTCNYHINNTVYEKGGNECPEQLSVLVT